MLSPTVLDSMSLQLPFVSCNENFYEAGEYCLLPLLRLTVGACYLMHLQSKWKVGTVWVGYDPLRVLRWHHTNFVSTPFKRGTQLKLQRPNL